MTPPPIRFTDGAAYDQGMGRWSTLAGADFLEWLAPEPNLKWLDVGCGSGAFTELILQRTTPAETHAIDPSPAQLAFARTRLAARATFQQADAMALPFEPGYFGAAVMALVIFFVPDPAKGVQEMVRVVRPGGLVAAYAWDMPDGFPFAPIQQELRAMGALPPLPPSTDPARIEEMQRLWSEAGLQSIETRRITVHRTFTGFDDFWSSSTGTGSIRPTLAAMPANEVERLKKRLEIRLPAGAQGRITCRARANAIKGRKPVST